MSGSEDMSCHIPCEQKPGPGTRRDTSLPRKRMMIHLERVPEQLLPCILYVQEYQMQQQ